ncbi:hypothetical protein TIFTF001_040069 [Ficus carica]|uniref:Uncharacterized protein n=1 Tax=Ficus carica TaxID=3494 RepID=A0AA87YRK7_FICCA|nr:hypothetical protein TIFTF001_040069 [Ficus carica]
MTTYAEWPQRTWCRIWLLSLGGSHMPKRIAARVASHESTPQGKALKLAKLSARAKYLGSILTEFTFARGMQNIMYSSKRNRCGRYSEIGHNRRKSTIPNDLDPIRCGCKRQKAAAQDNQHYYRISTIYKINILDGTFWILDGKFTINNHNQQNQHFGQKIPKSVHYPSNIHYNLPACRAWVRAECGAAIERGRQGSEGEDEREWRWEPRETMDGGCKASKEREWRERMHGKQRERMEGEF